MGSTEALIGAYSPVGDMFLIILCVSMLGILFETYTNRDRSFKLFCCATVLLIIAAISNMCFYKFATLGFSDIFLYVSRDIYHCALLSVVTVYVCYFDMLVGIEKHVARRVAVVCIIENIIVCILDVISPITHIGIYRDATGIWHDSPYVKPFTVGYVINVFLIVFMLYYYRKRVIQRLYRLFTMVGLVGFVVAMIETAFNTNAFLALSFSLPLVVALSTIHSNTYNIKTGTLNGSALINYIERRHHKGQTDTIICIKIYDKDEARLEEYLNMDFFRFYLQIFKRASQFSIGNNSLVIAIKDEAENDLEERMHNLCNLTIPKFLDAQGLNYKIVVLQRRSYENFDEFSNVYRFFLGRTPFLGIRYIGEQDYPDYERMNYIRHELKDICQRKDYDDPRVLAFFQPVFNPKTGNFDSGEALMRLELPQLGMVFPDEFIPLAEEYKYIHVLSLIILNKTCKTIRKALEDGYYIERISVNFSTIELKDRSFIHDFKHIIERNGIDYSYIGVEVTESQNEKDYHALLYIVQELKLMNVTTYLDDFGTGYSNFDRLLSLNLDIIKFDRALIVMTEHDQKAYYILKYFAEAFKRLNYSILYEGIETEEQELLCMESQADFLQGYKYSKPVPIEHLERYLCRA